MRINVGSQNQIKLKAVIEAIKDYPILTGALVIGKSVSSHVPEQPLSLRDVIQGAKNRAVAAYIQCDLAVGIESGLMRIPEARTGFLEVCICAIYNGNRHCLGASCAFELPRSVVELVVGRGLDLNSAVMNAGLTKCADIGTQQGAIGILTNDRITRKDYTTQALVTALIQLENWELYDN
jgi:inosine/xanthosine triphosphatase